MLSSAYIGVSFTIRPLSEAFGLLASIKINRLPLGNSATSRTRPTLSRRIDV
jgi:hypothetical protein